MPKRTIDNDPRARIVKVAAGLLQKQGRAAVTTRRVAELAGVQAPVIYRLFGDKDGLLDAVSDQVMADFTKVKRATASSAAAEGADPIADLRQGWDSAIDFGLANPELYVLFSDPTRRAQSAAARAGEQVLADRVHRVAEAGRLRVGEAEAVDLIHAAGTGVVLALIAKPEQDRDRSLADSMYDALLDRIVTPASGRSRRRKSSAGVSHAVALRAVAGDLEVLSDAERTLLAEWLDRIVDRG